MIESQPGGFQVVEALLCGVLCLRKRGQRVVTFLVFFFHQEFFELKWRDVAERRVKALGNVEGFNVNRRKTKERKKRAKRRRESLGKRIFRGGPNVSGYTVDG